VRQGAVTRSKYDAGLHGARVRSSVIGPGDARRSGEGLATWNVEHLGDKKPAARIPKVIDFLNAQKPDVLAIYEVEGQGRLARPHERHD
jgi:hypothetical protein